MVTILCLITIVYLVILNRTIFKGHLFAYPSKKDHILFSALFLLLSPLLAIIYHVFPDRFLGEIISFIVNGVDYNVEFFAMFYGPAFLFYIISFPFFITKRNFKILFCVIVLLPFLFVWPKYLVNNSCHANAPQNNAIGVWRGQSARFVTINNGNDPQHYTIYSVSSRNVLEQNIAIVPYEGRNACMGIEHDSRCVGVPIPSCQIPKDYSQFNN
jgi:hypothetical protein